MNEIIPRWEWRSFGPHFGDAESRLKAYGIGTTQHSDEIYLLSSMTDANVKIRNGFMDIKRLEQTDRQGFEQWRPILKAAFPLTTADIETVFAALGAAPPQDSSKMTLEQLISEAGADARLRKLEVQKTRNRYRPEGCMAELTEVTTENKTIHTIAVESENPIRIAAVLHALRLQGVENVSYPRGLKQLAGMTDLKGTAQ
jgi:exopolyphosphatase/guanosine-5'-triphosphate,3'-diphosphate pyrophosphatase